MNLKTIKIIYYISTGLLTVLMLMSAGMYLFNTQEIQESFQILGYPTYIVIPLAILKLLGLIAIWTKKSDTLKEWAYAGFFFDFILALTAHLIIGDGDYIPALMAIIFVLTSYIFYKKLNSSKN